MRTEREKRRIPPQLHNPTQVCMCLSARPSVKNPDVLPSEDGQNEGQIFDYYQLVQLKLRHFVYPSSILKFLQVRKVAISSIQSGLG